MMIWNMFLGFGLAVGVFMIVYSGLILDGKDYRKSRKDEEFKRLVSEACRLGDGK